jgi:pimeloyl-ACP methyl ester carboxylesterase
LSYDARAQGKSDLGNTPLSQTLHAHDLKALLDYLNIEKATLIGISHGSNIALVFSSLYAEKVEKLFLMSMTAGFPAKSMDQIRMWLSMLEKDGLEKMICSFLPYVFTKEFYNKNRDGAKLIADAMVKRNKTASMIAHLKAMLQYKPLSDFPIASSIPTLIVQGAEDQLAEAEQAQLLAEMCKGRFIQIKKTGHSIPAEQPDTLSELLIDFIQ